MRRLARKSINWVKTKTKRERMIFGLERSALSRIFIPTHHNTWTKSVGTILLLVIWGSIYVGTALDVVATQPPMYMEFTIIIMLILGRWWGVELVYQSLAEIEEETKGKGRGHHATPSEDESR